MCPATETWTSVADTSMPREYHSVAVLPSGGVFTGGGSLCGDCAVKFAFKHLNGQIYEPQYLFNADGTRAVRAEIQVSVATASPGEAVTLTTLASLQMIP
jgi:galactose oxidase